MNAPLRLTSICRRWRSVAQSTPQLWNALGITFRFSGPRIYPPSFLVKEWIDRTGGLLLSIDVYIPDYPDNQKALDSIIQMIKILNQHSNRWQYLKYSGLHRFFSYFSGYAQDLQQLHTLVIEDDRGGLSQPTLNLRPSKLTTFSANKVMLVSIVAFDWSHLTDLSLVCVLSTECLEALRIAPRLVQFTFRDARGALPDEIQFPLPAVPIVHATLRHIKLLHDVHFLYPIFEHLSCPSLKSLILANEHVHYGYRDRFEDEEERRIPLIVKITQFLKRSECSLEELSILGFYGDEFCLDAASMIPLYKEVPTLKRLHLKAAFWRLIEILAPLAVFSTVFDRKQPQYLPCLSSFSLETESHQNLMTVPDIFGSRIMHSDSVELSRHSLKFIAISVSYSSLVGDLNFLNEETLKRIIWLRDSAGVTWNLVRGDLAGGWKSDIIEAAVKQFYKPKVDE